MSDETPDSSPVTDAGRRVTREVEVEAATDEVWSTLAEPELRALWLDDDDARSRELRLDEVDDGRRLVWTWWQPDHEAAASTVEIVLAPTTGGTRVTVTETLAATRPGMAEASVRPGPATLRAGDLWSYRVLGLELLFVAAGVLVR
ncbi:MAG TPA: SRPBCC domain-containing protein [Acidimicrobiales bacterium]|nr:SRPBCC domain-containing protein [Acidimicrobiales bacterium]